MSLTPVPDRPRAISRSWRMRLTLESAMALGASLAAMAAACAKAPAPDAPAPQRSVAAAEPSAAPSAPAQVLRVIGRDTAAEARVATMVHEFGGSTAGPVIVDAKAQETWSELTPHFNWLVRVLNPTQGPVDFSLAIDLNDAHFATVTRDIQHHCHLDAGESRSFDGVTSVPAADEARVAFIRAWVKP